MTTEAIPTEFVKGAAVTRINYYNWDTTHTMREGTIVRVLKTKIVVKFGQRHDGTDYLVDYKANSRYGIGSSRRITEMVAADQSKYSSEIDIVVLSTDPKVAEHAAHNVRIAARSEAKKAADEFASHRYAGVAEAKAAIAALQAYIEASPAE